MISMLMRILRQIAPWLRKEESRQRDASRKTTHLINRYDTASEELQAAIRSNNFAKYLIYDKGD